MDQGNDPPRSGRAVRPAARRGERGACQAVRAGAVAADGALPPQRADPHAPLSLARQLTDLPIRAGSLPFRLFLPSPAFEAHRPTLAALFQCGALSSPRRRPRENPLAYTVRALGEWDRRYRAPLEVTLHDARSLLEELGGSFDPLPGGEQVQVETSDIVVRVYGPPSDTFSAAAMLAALRPAHPRLGGSLLTHIGRITRSSFGIFTPAEAWELTVMHDFYGSEREFWEQHRHAAACDQKKPDGELSNEELRVYVRANELMTPGKFKRALGPGVFQAIRRPLSLEAIGGIIAARSFPGAQRRQVEAVLAALSDLCEMGKRLQELSDDTDVQLCCMHQACHVRYATVLDVTLWEGTEGPGGFLQEVLNDVERQRMQSDEDQEGPNFALLLKAGGDSAVRFTEALELVDAACQSAIELTSRVDSWEG